MTTQNTIPTNEIRHAKPPGRLPVNSSTGIGLVDRESNDVDNPRPQHRKTTGKDMSGIASGDGPNRLPKSGMSHKSSASKLVGPRADLNDHDHSKWIHREKLIAIEIQEMRDRGMEIPPELLRRAERRDEGIEGYDDDGFYGQVGSPNGTVKGRQGYGSIIAETHPGTDDSNSLPLDPRSLEEIAADAGEMRGSHTPGYNSSLRAGSSRIPISKSSPLPVPQEHLARHNPLPRKRGTSGNWDEEGLIYNKSRSRGNSISSQILLDDFSPSSSPPSPTSKKLVQSAKNSAPSVRKTSAQGHKVSGTKPRVTSGTRPSTRSGIDDRPRTAVNRPEGDPPWLATMYKPDPRLPPDQQMLPTHAKRMMQEQLQKEAVVGETYDRNLNPLNVLPDRPSVEQPRQQQTPSPSKAANDHPYGGSAWPLRPPELQMPPEQPAKTNGGYSTMPRISRSPSQRTLSLVGTNNVPGRAFSPGYPPSPRVPPPSPRFPPPQGVQAGDLGLSPMVSAGPGLVPVMRSAVISGPERKEKKSGCCVVM